MEPMLDGENPITDDRPPVLNSFQVHHRCQQRLVSCFCGQTVVRSVVPHLKDKHPIIWDEWVQHFVELRSRGFPLKRIMRLYRAGNGPLLFSWTVIDRAVRNAVESGVATFNPKPTLSIAEWEPDDFRIPVGTIWDFPKRGDWAVHSGDYRGNWPPQLVRSLILKYTEPSDTVVDPFVGGGTTLIEAWLNGRKSFGIDVSRLALQTTRAKIAEMLTLARDDPRVRLRGDLQPKIVKGDALALSDVLATNGVLPSTVSLVCAHPPYLDSIRYTENNPRDLSLIKNPTTFLERIGEFASQACYALTDRGVCAFLIGDIRKKGRLIALGLSVSEIFQQHGFTLESIIIKTQHHKRSTEFYRAIGDHLSLLEHEYLFIFRKSQS